MAEGGRLYMSVMGIQRREQLGEVSTTVLVFILDQEHGKDFTRCRSF